MATVPFLVEEFGGVNRTLSPMRFPIVIPLAASDNVLTVNTSRVLDGATPVPAQFEIIGRYGGSNGQMGGVNDDATKPARLLHIYMQPTLSAGGVKNYTYQSTGGTGNTIASPITVQAVSTHYVVNTGTGGIIAHIPRTGPQSILRFLQMVGGATILSGDGGGLWIKGVAGDSQAGDYFSRFDTAADGLTNNWAPTEQAQPVKWFTEHTKPGPLVTTFTVRRVRLRPTAGAATAFQGKSRIPPGSAASVPRDLLCDVQLTFFRNRPEILVRVINLSTGGGHHVVAVDQAADCWIDGFGLDFATVFGGTSPTIAVRDEGAAEKWTSATASTNVVVRQRTTGYTNSNGSRPTATYISGATYGWALEESGPLTLASATTQLESGVDVTGAGGAGLLVAAWNWKNRFPMGWTYTAASGVLRWEILNPSEGDTTRAASEHVLLGFQWCYAEAWVIPHAATLTNAQRRDAVRATAGRHVYRHNGATVDTDLTHPIRGRQQATLLGRCSGAVWNASGAWRMVPRAKAARIAAPGMLTNVGGQMPLAPLLPGSATRWDDACSRYDDWFEAEFDDTKLTGSGQEFVAVQNASMELTHAVPNPGNSAAGYTIGAITGPLGWREDGCYPCSGGAIGPNDYEQNSYPGLWWLSTGHPHHFALGWERSLHQATSDVMKMYYSTTPRSAGSGHMHALHGRNVSPFGGRRFHSDGGSGGDSTGSALEFQQLHEALVWYYALTGDDVIRQSIDFVSNFISDHFLGGRGIAVHDCYNRWSVTGTATNGSATLTNVSDTSAVTIGPGGVWCTYTPMNNNVALGNASSSGNVITLATPAGFDASTGKHFWTPGGAQAAEDRQAGFGMRLQFPDGTGPIYEVIEFSSLATQSNPTAPTAFIVKPTPPALTNQPIAAKDFVHNGAQRFITGKTATTLTLGSGNTTNNHTTGPVTITAASSGLLRRTAWPLHTMVALSRVFGEHLRTAQYPEPGFRLFEGAWAMAQHLLFSEQEDSSPGAIAQMGGLGTAINPGQQGPPFLTHGTVSHINVTSTDYAVNPLLESHVFATQMAALGYGAIFTSATRTAILNLLDRYCRFMFMGVDGLSPIESGGDMLLMSAPHRIPMARGGDLQSPTSYHMVSHVQFFPVVELPEAAGRTGIEAFRTCASDLSSMTTSPWPGQRFGNNNFNLTSGKGSTSADQVGADVLVYVAEQKYHPGDVARRTAYTRKAIQAWIDGATFMTTGTGGNIGTYHNPNTWGNIWGGRGTNGNAINVIRHRHWLVNYGARLFDRVATGWSGGVVDTTPPDETALLALVSRTDVQIVVDGPAATDDVGVAEYLFFKDGVQDGAAQAGTAHTFTGLTASQSYALTRRARDVAGNTSNPSNTVTASTLGSVDTDPPTVPTGLEATAGTDTVTLTWLPSTDEESGIKRYLIERTPPGSIVGEVVP